MSFHHSPKIVTNGLVLYLDAANRKSYSGSGNTWRDLSGNDNNGNLVNSPSFTDNVFNFTGNNYITTPLNVYSQDNSIFSINLWFKATANGIILHQTTAANNGTNNGWVPAVYIDSNNKLRVTCFWGGSISNQTYISSNDVIYNKWYNIVHTFDSSNNRRVYIDGLLVSTINGAQASYSSTFYLILGAGAASGWPNDPATGMRGSISNFSFYRKTLLQTEILQNYNAIKGRFNL